MLGHRALPFLDRYGPLYPFQKTSSLLKSADFTLANLEAPFTSTGQRFKKKYTFKVPPEFAQGLKDAGIDGVSLANNHILDYGQEGLLSTMDVLEQLGIKYSGAGKNLCEAQRPTILVKDGIKVAFLAYSMTFPQQFYATADRGGVCYPWAMAETIRECERVADYTVLSFHWGAELMEHPKDYQRRFAHLAVDCGADLIFGHHPHVLQGMEIYKNRLIAYSLGNFTFGSYSSHARYSVLLKVYLNQDGLVFARLHPLSVYNAKVLFQPTPLDGKEAQRVLDKLSKISMPLNNGRDIISDEGIILGELK